MNSLNSWEFPPPVFFSIYSSYRTSCSVNYSSMFSNFHCSIELLLVKFMWVTHSFWQSIIYTRQGSYNKPLLREAIQALHSLFRTWFLLISTRQSTIPGAWDCYKNDARRVIAFTVHRQVRALKSIRRSTVSKLLHLKTSPE